VKAVGPRPTGWRRGSRRLFTLTWGDTIRERSRDRPQDPLSVDARPGSRRARPPVRRRPQSARRVARISLAALLLLDLALRARDLATFYSDVGVFPRSALAHHYPAMGSVSIHAISGAVWVQALLFLVAAAFATALSSSATGPGSPRWRRWCCSSPLHARNPMVLNAGDVLFRRLLFWGLFLPSEPGGRSPPTPLEPPTANVTGSRLSPPWRCWCRWCSCTSPTSRSSCGPTSGSRGRHPVRVRTGPVYGRPRIRRRAVPDPARTGRAGLVRAALRFAAPPRPHRPSPALAGLAACVGTPRNVPDDGPGYLPARLPHGVAPLPPAVGVGPR